MIGAAFLPAAVLAASAAQPGPPPVPPAIVVPAPLPRTSGDPLEGFNRGMFAAHQRFDRALLRPAALGYKHVVPRPARSGIRNVLRNLGEPIVFLNDLLQLKPGRALRTFERFAINTTLGIGGLIDLAGQEGVEHRANGFGNTLAYYGVKSGPYLFLPFVGPTTLRDFIGGQGDGLVLPLAVGTPFDELRYQVPKAVVSGLDQRAEADADLNALLGGAVDPYATLRSVWLQNRAGEIAALHSRKAAPGGNPLDDPLADPAGAEKKRVPSPLDDPLADPAGEPPKPLP